MGEPVLAGVGYGFGQHVCVEAEVGQGGVVGLTHFGAVV